MTFDVCVYVWQRILGVKKSRQERDRNISSEVSETGIGN
jgi:hypothetical protein